MYAALEIDYNESDKDSTGEAFERTKKVRSRLPTTQAELTIVPDFLRAGSGSQPRREEMERADRSKGKHAGAG